MLEAAQVIKDMGKRVEEIGDIVQTINLIADRTNLLSLNASIEAARAGEHGRGFAVVAEEIRALADRAGDASADIAKIVRGLQSTARDAVTASADGVKATDEGAKLASDAERALGAILQGVEELAQATRDVDGATSEQVQAVDAAHADQPAARRGGPDDRPRSGGTDQGDAGARPGRRGDAQDGAPDHASHGGAGAGAARRGARSTPQLATNAEKVARASEQQSQAAADLARVGARRCAPRRNRSLEATAEQAKSASTVESLAQRGGHRHSAHRARAERAGKGRVRDRQGDQRRAQTSRFRSPAGVAEQLKANQAGGAGGARRRPARVQRQPRHRRAGQRPSTRWSLSGETVRRFARQTARAVGEQVRRRCASLTTAANRHTAAREPAPRGRAAGRLERRARALVRERARARTRDQARCSASKIEPRTAAARTTTIVRGRFDVSSPSVRMSEAEAERIGRVRQLGNLGSESVDVLIDQLDDPSWVVRRAVVEVLVAPRRSAPVSPLCDALRRHRDNESRLAAITDALSASSADVDERCSSSPATPNPAVVADAAQILGRRRSKRATSPAGELTQAPNDNVAVSAIEALGASAARPLSIR